MIASICALLKTVIGEEAWNSTGDRLQGPCHLIRNDQDRKIRARKQRTDNGKYSFVNMTIKLWNQVPAETLRLFPVNRIFFGKKVREVILSEE